MQVREVDHRPDPAGARGDREHVVGGAELPHAAHHLDAERDEAVLRLEPLAQLAELRDDVVERRLALAAEQEARMEDDHLGAAGHRDARRVVEHPDRHPVLLVALDVAEEAASGACTERTTPASRASSPKRSAQG